MNNQRSILVKDRTILIAYQILFTFAFLIVLQSSVECSPFPEWQPFTEQYEVNLVRDGAAGTKLFPLLQEYNSNWLSNGIELFPFISADCHPVTNEKTNQASNKTHSNCYKYIINHFEILYLIGVVSFLCSLFIGFHFS